MQNATKITPEYQAEIFNQITGLKYTVMQLASYIQNDFELMLEDGHATKESIQENIEFAESSFDNAIETLNRLKSASSDIMKHYAS